MSETVLQNGQKWSYQDFPFFVGRGYRRKPESRNMLIMNALLWTAYIVVLAVVFITTPFFKVLIVLLGSINIVPPLYMLAKGMYLKPGEKYVKPKHVPPEVFLEEVKAEAKAKKK